MMSGTPTATRAEEGQGSGEVPVVLSGLSKHYRAVMAVDRVDLVIGAGQVYGLLGPNGAGKTTIMRMLLGLVRPSAGEARVFGERVGPGARVLRRVGALVDSPGFVPHRSGLANLEMFWKAGGQKLPEAHLEDALAIADLGDAIRRRYRTYSHGMRQRLGIAQALLGRPELLVLDEPTSGLDPQQMREIRELVGRVAAQGTTVVLSSHLLSEVEQVCDHVAVMNRGTLVQAGSVSELTGAVTTAYLEVDDRRAAREVLSRLPGVRRVGDDGGGLSVELDGVTRQVLVAALVRAGIGVETVTSRRRLEDAFIALLEETPG
jgi:ABC-2 type transport system ATP-binding protein